MNWARAPASPGSRRPPTNSKPWVLSTGTLRGRPRRLDSHCTRCSCWAAPTSTGWRCSGWYTAWAQAACRTKPAGTTAWAMFCPAVSCPYPCMNQPRLKASSHAAAMPPQRSQACCSSSRAWSRSALVRRDSGGGVWARSACSSRSCSRCTCQACTVASASMPRGLASAPAGMARPSARACSLVSSEGELACFMAWLVSLGAHLRRCSATRVMSLGTRGGAGVMSMSSFSRVRARDRRDMTVPTGTCSTRAASA